MTTPRQKFGFRRAVVDEQKDDNGALSYAVSLYNDHGARVVTRIHSDFEAAAREVIDWMDWSSRRPVDTTPLKRNQP